MDPPPPGWMSASNSVSVLFETGPDANQTGDMGWEVFPSFIACPNYGYTTGSYGMVRFRYIFVLPFHHPSML